MSARRVPLGAALFCCAVVATLLVAVLVVRARTPDLVLEVREPPADHPATIQPRGTEVPRQVKITFFVRESDSHARVAIVDSHENVVRTLDSDAALTDHQEVTYTWDGRTDAGGIAAPGRYRLAVDLPSEDREMIWPRRITLLLPASKD